MAVSLDFESNHGLIIYCKKTAITRQGVFGMSKEGREKNYHVDLRNISAHAHFGGF